MKKNRIIALLILVFLLFTLFSCKHRHTLPIQGYVEGELVYMASPYSGKLSKLLVQRGQEVAAMQPLFQLDEAPQIYQLQDAKAKLAEAEKKYLDLKNPKRLPEQKAIQAQIDQTEVEIKLAKLRVERYTKLYQKNASDRDHLDEALAKQDELLQQKNQYQENLNLAQLGSREEQINAQLEQIKSYKAQLLQSKWQLNQKALQAADAGIIFDTYYRPGEFVAAEKPVLSILTPSNTRIEFFVPVHDLAGIKLGQKLQFSCEGCPKENTGQINYISPEAEYVPPLVYSRDNKDKLVFRIKASLTNPKLYKPGQPVLITGFEDD